MVPIQGLAFRNRGHIMIAYGKNDVKGSWTGSSIWYIGGF